MSSDADDSLDIRIEPSKETSASIKELETKMQALPEKPMEPEKPMQPEKSVEP